MERAKKGEGLDRWLRMDRKKRREEATRLATLAKLGELVLASIKKHDDDSAAGLITNDEQRFLTTRDAIQAAQDLGLLPRYGFMGEQK